MKSRFLSLLAVAMMALTMAGTAQAAPEATCTSGGSGNWTAITWSGCAGTPQPGDDVVIATGTTVTLDTSTTITSLTVQGTLRFGNNTTSRAITVTGAVTISVGGAINLSNNNAGHVLNVGDNLTNNSTFNGYQNGNRYIDVTFNGAGQQIISGSGAPAMRNLQVNSGSRVIFPSSSLPTVNGTMIVNSGGAVQQTQTVNNGTVNFMQISTSAYRGVDLITANNLGSTTVVITTTVNGGCTTTGTSSPAYATRCYEITPANNLAATVRLYALTATQLNGIAQANLRVYRYTNGWQQLTTNASTGSATGGYSYAQADTPGFSDFLLGDAAPTALALSTFHAQSQTSTWPLPIGLLLAAGVILLWLKHRAR